MYLFGLLHPMCKKSSLQFSCLIQFVKDLLPLIHNNPSLLWKRLSSPRNHAHVWWNWHVYTVCCECDCPETKDEENYRFCYSDAGWLVVSWDTGQSSPCVFPVGSWKLVFYGSLARRNQFDTEGRYHAHINLCLKQDVDWQLTEKFFLQLPLFLSPSPLVYTQSAPLLSGTLLYIYILLPWQALLLEI